MNATKKDIFLIDFDGTIALNDTTHIICNYYIPDMLEEYRRRFRAGEVNVKQFIYDLLTSLNIDEDEFRKSILKLVKIDETIIEFMQKDVEYRIVSAGTNLNVRYAFESIGINIEDDWVYANKLEFEERTLKITHPYLDKEDQNGVDKAEIVLKYKKEGYRVIFVGDGPSDYKGASQADIVFARKGTRLGEKCNELNIKYHVFECFNHLYDVYEKNYKII